MKKILITIVFMISAFVHVAAEFIEDKPAIFSANRHSFLQESNFSKQELEENCGIDSMHQQFALSSFDHLKKSVIKYLSVSDRSSFYSYCNNTKASRKMKVENRLINSWIKFNLQTGCDFVTIDDKNYYFVYYGTRLQGNIFSKFRFFSNWWAGHFQGDEDYYRKSNLIDSWFQTSDDNEKLYLDNFSGRLEYYTQNWQISVGRDKHEIGSNIAGSIILSNDANEYGFFNAKFKLPKFYISFLQGSLISDSTASANPKDYADKYLVLHQFGWKPNSKLHFFVGEEVVYGDRGIDLNYMLPISFYRAIEHNLRDRDNVLIFCGAEWKYHEKHLLYGNFIFDELKKSEIFGNWWGNKYAFQVGNSFAVVEECSLVLEFTAIRPWMYTHKILHNKFSHDDHPLGFPSGANLIQYSCELTWNILSRLNCNIFASYLRKGSVGDHFSINYNSRPSDQANWLEGEISDELKLSPVITWKPLAHHAIKIGLNSVKIDDDQFENELYLSYQTIY